MILKYSNLGQAMYPLTSSTPCKLLYNGRGAPFLYSYLCVCFFFKSTTLKKNTLLLQYFGEGLEIK